MPERRRITIALTAATAVLATAAVVGPVAGASAATRYAAPQGGINTVGTPPCTDPSKPCVLVAALGTALAGDDVQLAGGNYFKSTKDPGPGAPKLPFDDPVDVPSDVVLHGGNPAALPVIHVAPNATGESGVVMNKDSEIRDVAITGSAAGSALRTSSLLLNDALAERVRVETTGAPGVAQNACLVFEGSVLRSSVCLGRGSASDGTVAALTATASAGAVSIRNVTAITTADSSPGLDVVSSGGSIIANVSNSILRGTAADLSLKATSGGGAFPFIDHTNWGTQISSATVGSETKVFLGAGNQNGQTAAAPTFVNALAGDFREAAGSPTIDAGVVDAAKNGPLALGGAGRVLGSSTDIGAFEFDPSTVPPTTPEPTTPEPTTPEPTTPTGAPGAGGISAGQGATLSAPTVDLLAPTLTGLKLARSVKRSKGTTIQFTLNEPASVVVAFGQPRSGRSVAGKCQKTTAKNRKQPRCTIPNVKGTLTVEGRAGANTVSFKGRVASGKRLPLGSYSLEATPTDAAGNRGLVSTRKFTLKR